MTEARMYLRLKDGLKNHNIYLQRIETGIISPGVPDIHYVTGNSSGWIELKSIRRYPIKNEEIKIPFRPGQYAWIRNYCRFSQTIFVFCHIENALWIFKGNDIKLVYKDSVEMIGLSCYKSLWQNINYQHIFNVLF